MLKQRIVTALILLAVLLPAVFYPQTEPFALLAALMVGAAAWEWSRMNGFERWALPVGFAVVALLAVFWGLGGLNRTWPWVWGLSSLAWLVLAVGALGRGVSAWPSWPAVWRLLGGVSLLAVAWLALVQARQIGLVFLLSVLTLVWAADIAAYAGGKAFGRRKLAPTVSPGKSWEGAFSGLVGVVLLGVFWVWFDRGHASDTPSLFTLLWSAGVVWTAPAVALLTATSVIGDLMESLVKRSAGMKDSSQLLPGHGGVLDRVDALLPVLPLAMLMAQLLETGP